MLKLFLILFMTTLSSLCEAQNYTDEISSPSDIFLLRKSKMHQISSSDTTGGNNDRINIPDGEKAVLADLTGPGIITRIWVTIDSRDPYFLRRIVLRMFWDGEENPSVEVPVGDFFGTGFQYSQYISQYTGMSSGGYYCYFPMPFNKSAKIEVENQTGKEVYAFYYQIDFQQLEKPLNREAGYFHAYWNREIRTDKKENYQILEAEGEGQFVGLNMSMQGYAGNLWYLEGDEMVYVDGEDIPSVQGTGTEDYFTSGWYFNQGVFSAPYHGLIIKDDSSARIAAYRFQVGDAIPFRKSILFSIEHGHANEETADYSSTAFWYQKEPHKKFPPLLKASLRLPLRAAVPEGIIEAEDLEEDGTEIKNEVMAMDDYGPDWSGNAQLQVNFRKLNENFELDLPAELEDIYNVDIYYTTAPGYGNIKITHNGREVGNISGYHDEVYPGGKITLKNLKSEFGKIKLKFSPVGKESKSTGYGLGLDGFKIEPDRVFIPDWYVIGPFANPRNSETDRKGIDIIYPPEEEFDTGKTYSGIDSQLVRWKLMEISKNGFLSLWNKFDPYELIVAYAHTFIYAPEDQRVDLLIGTDDGAKVFLNDKEIYRFLEVRIAEPDQDVITLDLKKGWNSLLIKIENNFGGYGFYARLRDLNNSLKINPLKQ